MSEETAKAFASSIQPRTREYIDAKIEDPLRAMNNAMTSNEKYNAKMEAEIKERLASMEGRITNMEQIPTYNRNHGQCSSNSSTTSTRITNGDYTPYRRPATL